MLKKLTERIYYLEGDEFTDRPFIYYINGDRESLAVDAGESANHVAYFYKELEKNKLRKPDYTVITHWHWDHTFGMHAVSGKTIASEITDEKLEQMKSWEWTNEAIEERLKSGKDIKYCMDCLKREYAYLNDIITVQADEIIKGERIIELGGVTCCILQHDNTHSRDGLFVYIPTEKALVVGDADYEDYYDNDYRYDKKRLNELIEFISQFDFKYYLRGHEGIMKKEEALCFLNSRRNSNAQSIVANM